MINSMLAQTATFLSPSGEVLRQIPPSGTVATVVSGAPLPTIPTDGIATLEFAAPSRVDGLPDPSSPDPILVPAIVAAAMRQLGLRHAAGVYTLQPGPAPRPGRALGTPGLIYHTDLSSC
jgi:hypothetical protein